MFFYMYKITHIESGKFYIGRRCSLVHPSKDPYMGSGMRLLLTLEKYGDGAFIKQVLSIHDTLEELVLEEKRVVDSVLLSDPLCYNLAEGGWGGYTFYDDRVYTHSDEARRKISESKIDKKRPDLVERHKTDDSFKLKWKGVKRSDEDRANKAAARKALIDSKKDVYFTSTGACPHCGKTGQLANMKRWHYDRCKFANSDGVVS